MDEEFCREQVRIVRELADKADPFIKRRLLELARHYERRISIGKDLLTLGTDSRSSTD
jgi:hypothetical protein